MLGERREIRVPGMPEPIGHFAHVVKSIVEESRGADAAVIQLHSPLLPAGPHPDLCPDRRALRHLRSESMTDWHTIVVEAPDAVLRGFVAGFLAGREEPREAVLHGPDLGIDGGTLGERLRALLHGGRHEVLLVEARLAGALASALAQHADEIGARVAAHAGITGASFAFHAETPSRAAAEHIRAALGALPTGVMLTDGECEEIDPDVAGVELYAPAHAYTFRAGGRIGGTLEGVLAMHRRLSETDFVTPEPLQLEETPLPPVA